MKVEAETDLSPTRPFGDRDRWPATGPVYDLPVRETGRLPSGPWKSARDSMPPVEAAARGVAAPC